MGYKSVAHYLIQTRRHSDIDVEKNADASNPVSAKRSLPFSDEVNENKLESLKPLAETESDGDEVAAKRSLPFSDKKDQLEKVEGSNTIEKVECSDTTKPLASSTKPCPDSIAGRLRSRAKKP